MDKLRAFCSNYTLRDANGRDLSVDLGEICHYLTDFFCYPHNDDLYPHGLLAHCIYEKRVAMRLSRSLTKEHFEGWVDGVVAPYTVEGLISRIRALHDKYRALPHHGIVSDMEFICKVNVLCVSAVINIAYESERETVTAMA